MFKLFRKQICLFAFFVERKSPLLPMWINNGTRRINKVPTTICSDAYCTFWYMYDQTSTCSLTHNANNQKATLLTMCAQVISSVWTKYTFWRSLFPKNQHKLIIDADALQGFGSLISGGVRRSRTFKYAEWSTPFNAWKRTEEASRFLRPNNRIQVWTDDDTQINVYCWINYSFDNWMHLFGPERDTDGKHVKTFKSPKAGRQVEWLICALM